MKYPAEIFTKEAMTRPLFEPLSEKHERPDEWSGPLGFVLGGMATLGMRAERDGALAEQYFNAASATGESRTIRSPTRLYSFTGIVSNCC